MNSRYHYWIVNRKRRNHEQVMNLYWLSDQGVKKPFKKCIYQEVSETILRRPYVLKENLVISESFSTMDCNIVEISSSARFIFNDKYTILELDHEDNDFAEKTLKTLCTETDENVVIFFVD